MRLNSVQLTTHTHVCSRTKTIKQISIFLIDRRFVCFFPICRAFIDNTVCDMQIQLHFKTPVPSRIFRTSIYFRWLIGESASWYKDSANRLFYFFINFIFAVDAVTIIRDYLICLISTWIYNIAKRCHEYFLQINTFIGCWSIVKHECEMRWKFLRLFTR